MATWRYYLGHHPSSSVEPCSRTGLCGLEWIGCEGRRVLVFPASVGGSSYRYECPSLAGQQAAVFRVVRGDSAECVVSERLEETRSTSLSAGCSVAVDPVPFYLPNDATQAAV